MKTFVLFLFSLVFFTGNSQTPVETPSSRKAAMEVQKRHEQIKKEGGNERLRLKKYFQELAILRELNKDYDKIFAEYKSDIYKGYVITGMLQSTEGLADLTFTALSYAQRGAIAVSKTTKEVLIALRNEKKVKIFSQRYKDLKSMYGAIYDYKQKGDKRKLVLTAVNIVAGYEKDKVMKMSTDILITLNNNDITKVDKILEVVKTVAEGNRSGNNDFFGLYDSAAKIQKGVDNIRKFPSLNEQMQIKIAEEKAKVNYRIAKIKREIKTLEGSIEKQTLSNKKPFTWKNYDCTGKRVMVRVKKVSHSGKSNVWNIEFYNRAKVGISFDFAATAYRTMLINGTSLTKRISLGPNEMKDLSVAIPGWEGGPIFVGINKAIPSGAAEEKYFCQNGGNILEFSGPKLEEERDEAEELFAQNTGGTSSSKIEERDLPEGSNGQKSSETSSSKSENLEVVQKSVPNRKPSIKCKELAQKYYDKGSSSSGMDGYTYLSCAEVAIQLCSDASQEDFDRFLAASVKAIKAMDMSPNCPCPDVIPQEIWSQF